MAQTEGGGTGPKVPAERADLKRAPEGGRDGPDRPGFDLGGGADTSAPQGAIPDGGPAGDPTLGDAHPTGGSELTSDKATPA